MNIAYHKSYSSFLHRDMEYKVYGDRGKPVLVFPTSCGRFYQYEDSGMIGALEREINEGRIQVWTCDSIDEETFYAKHPMIEERMARHQQYDQYVEKELIPVILERSKESNGGRSDNMIVTGCSMGAFHAANFFFRHPHDFDGLIALSGLYSTNRFFGDYMSEAVYYHSPLHYLRNLEDEALLSSYRSSRIVVCTGQGAYEDLMRSETQKLKQVLEEKRIPADVEFWGYDVSHDWSWWKKQIAYYMERLLNR
ncbi:esterase family protein [Paenibacillus chartarius]|uniref:Esterase family protein n=1 Tax=Paenibacillus chartarius TaxID=747481 RepID=A0ABV6DPI9_9BACL